MFNGCIALQTVPLFNTVKVTSMNSMFNGCVSLQTVPLFNTAAVTGMTSMFSGCSSLQTVPLFNTAEVLNMGSTFQSCSSLKTVPLFNTVKVTNTGSMFNGCNVLQTVPLFNTAEVTNMGSMFNNCYVLQTVPLFNTLKVTVMTGMLQNCPSLIQVPELNLNAVSTNANNNLTITSAVSLGQIKLTGMRWTQSFNGCNMAAAQLDEMYTALDNLAPSVTTVSGSGTVVTYTVNDITAFVAARTVTITGVDPVAYNLTGVSVASVNTGLSQFTVTNAASGAYVSGGTATLTNNKTITVTGNPGTTTDDPTIATNKGWTVTGS